MNKTSLTLNNWSLINFDEWNISINIFAAEFIFDSEQANAVWVIHAEFRIYDLGFGRFKIPYFYISSENHIEIIFRWNVRIITTLTILQNHQ